MSVTKEYCLTLPTGEELFHFSLINANGTEAKVTNLGAIITAFKVKNKNGTKNDIVLGFDQVEEYLSPAYLASYPWMGCTVGRYGNRIGNARMVIDNKEYQLSANLGKHQLHGGFNGYDRKPWQMVSFGDNPVSFVEMKYISVDGEEGFPGTVEVTARFELSEEDELSYQFSAITDKPTAINLTHHGYFNLNNGQGDIKDHEVKIYASAVLEQDAELVCNGNLQSTHNSVLDFSEFTPLTKRIETTGGIDKSFVADRQNNSPALSLMAEARSIKSRITLQVYSSEPVVHLYTGGGFPVLKGKQGTEYGSYSGFCLETQVHPNAINVPQFPNTILRPGEKYYSKTTYKVIHSL